MWIMRCARPDLAFAVSFVSRFLTRRSFAADGLLSRVLTYLDSTADLRSVSGVRPGDALRPVSFVDADPGGCPLSSRSTTGKCLFLVGG